MATQDEVDEARLSAKLMLLKSIERTGASNPSAAQKYATAYALVAGTLGSLQEVSVSK